MNELPTYTKKRIFNKFGEETKSMGVRLPISTIEAIKTRNVDVGTMIHEIITGLKKPDGYVQAQTESLHNEITKKLIDLMIQHKVVAPEGFFTATEIGTITLLVKGED